MPEKEALALIKQLVELLYKTQVTEATLHNLEVNAKKITNNVTSAYFEGDFKASKVNIGIKLKGLAFNELSEHLTILCNQDPYYSKHIDFFRGNGKAYAIVSHRLLSCIIREYIEKIRKNAGSALKNKIKNTIKSTSRTIQNQIHYSTIQKTCSIVEQIIHTNQKKWFKGLTIKSNYLFKLVNIKDINRKVFSLAQKSKILTPAKKQYTPYDVVSENITRFKKSELAHRVIRVSQNGHAIKKFVLHADNTYKVMSEKGTPSKIKNYTEIRTKIEHFFPDGVGIPENYLNDATVVIDSRTYQKHITISYDSAIVQSQKILDEAKEKFIYRYNLSETDKTRAEKKFDEAINSIKEEYKNSYQKEVSQLDEALKQDIKQIKRYSIGNMRFIRLLGNFKALSTGLHSQKILANKEPTQVRRGNTHTNEEIYNQNKNSLEKVKGELNSFDSKTYPVEIEANGLTRNINNLSNYIDENLKLNAYYAALDGNLSAVASQTNIDFVDVRSDFDSSNTYPYKDTHPDLEGVYDAYKSHKKHFSEIKENIEALDKEISKLGLDFEKFKNNLGHYFRTGSTFYCGIPLHIFWTENGFNIELFKQIGEDFKKYTKVAWEKTKSISKGIYHQSKTKAYNAYVTTKQKAYNVYYQAKTIDWKTVKWQQPAIRTVGGYFTLVDATRAFNRFYQGKIVEGIYYTSVAVGTYFAFNPKTYLFWADKLKHRAFASKVLKTIGEKFFQSRGVAVVGIILMLRDLSLHGETFYNEVSTFAKTLDREVFSSIPGYNWVKNSFIGKSIAFNRDMIVGTCSIANRYVIRPTYVFADNTLTHVGVFSPSQAQFNYKDLKDMMEKQEKTLQQWEKIWARKRDFFDKKYEKLVNNLKNTRLTSKKKEALRRLFLLQYQKILAPQLEGRLNKEFSYFCIDDRGKLIERKISLLSLILTKRTDKILFYGNGGKLLEPLMPIGYTEKGQIMNQSLPVSYGQIKRFTELGRIIIKLDKVDSEKIGTSLWGRFLGGHKSVKSYLSSVIQHKRFPSVFKDAKELFNYSNTLYRLSKAKLNYGEVIGYNNRKDLVNFQKTFSEFAFASQITEVILSKKLGFIPKKIHQLENVLNSYKFDKSLFLELSYVIQSGNQQVIYYNVRNRKGQIILKNKPVGIIDIYRQKMYPGSRIFKKTSDFDYTYTSLKVNHFTVVPFGGLIKQQMNRMDSILEKVSSPSSVLVIHKINNMKTKKPYLTLQNMKGDILERAINLKELSNIIGQKKKYSQKEIISPEPYKENLFGNESIGKITYSPSEGIISFHDKASNSSYDKEKTYFLEKIGNKFRLWNNNHQMYNFQSLKQIDVYLKKYITEITILYKTSIDKNASSLAYDLLTSSSKTNEAKKSFDIGRRTKIVLQDGGRSLYYLNFEEKYVFRTTLPYNIKQILINNGISPKQASYWELRNWRKPQKNTFYFQPYNPGFYNNTEEFIFDFQNRFNNINPYQQNRIRKYRYNKYGWTNDSLGFQDGHYYMPDFNKFKQNNGNDWIDNSLDLQNEQYYIPDLQRFEQNNNGLRYSPYHDPNHFFYDKNNDLYPLTPHWSNSSNK